MMETQTPEWIITTRDNPKNTVVDFSQLFSLKDQITSVMLLWDFNSYYVNILEKYFIINGGRRVKADIVDLWENHSLFYRLRHSKSFTVNGLEEVDENVFFLVGLEGEFNGDKTYLFLKIAEDGKLWCWSNVK